MTAPRPAPGGFPVVGIIGGGQLARMCAGPAVELGVTLSVLAEGPDVPAAQAIRSAPVGDHTDVEAVRAFAQACDVVTFDHEHVPAEILAALEADGVALHPAPSALRFAQDKLAMRERLSAIGIACPRWARARTAADIEHFVAGVGGWPVVAKTPRGGYDGKGVRVITSVEDVADWLDRTALPQGSAGALAGGMLLEEKIEFVREIAVLVARSPSGQAVAWPVVETLQADSVCVEVLAPAPGLDRGLAATATAAGLRIAGELDVTGVLAIEMFEVRDRRTGDPAYLVNELAMRPHNCGHWSMDGAVTGQFEQHLRAVLDLPLGSPVLREPVTVMANVLGGDHAELYSAYRHILARTPELKVHMYGKEVRPGRKIGHVNISGSDLEALREKAAHAAGYLAGTVTE